MSNETFETKVDKIVRRHKELEAEREVLLAVAHVYLGMISIEVNVHAAKTMVVLIMDRFNLSAVDARMICELTGFHPKTGNKTNAPL